MRSNASIGLAGKALELATLVPLVTVLPRVLGAADYGVLALGLSIVAIAGGTASLGGPTMATRFVAGAPPEARAGLALAVVRRSAPWRLAVAGAVAGAVLVARPGHIPAGAAWLVLGALVLDVLATLLLQASLPLGGIVAWSVRYPLQNVVLSIAAVALHGRGGALGSLGALPLASGAALLFALGVAAPRLRGSRPADALPDGLRRFAVVQGASGLMQLILLRGAVVATALAGGAGDETGYAGVAVGVAAAATYAVWQPYVVELPRLVSLPAAEARAWLMRTTRLATVVLVPASVVGVLVTEHVVPRVLGRSFADGATALGIALAAVPLAPATAAVNQAAALELRPGIRLVSATAGALVFAVAAAALVAPYGAAGASCALVAGVAATALAGAVLCAHVFPLRRALVATIASALVVVLAVLG